MLAGPELQVCRGDCQSQIPISRLDRSAARLSGFPHRRWAQQLGGIDFLPPPPVGAPLQGAEGEDGNVLAGLAEYRQGGRALKIGISGFTLDPRQRALKVGGPTPFWPIHWKPEAYVCIYTTL